MCRLDASIDDGTLGRLVNDQHRGSNCNMRVLLEGVVPHLCLFAVQNVHPGDKITYNYGKDQSFPWRVFQQIIEYVLNNNLNNYHNVM